jgi:pyridoxamine 5'-phosphate oxidase
MKDPIALFQAWLQEAIEAKLKEPTAMTVATVDVDGHPDARMLLLKGCDERGFVFFTNLESPKARALLNDSARGALLSLGGARKTSAHPRPGRSRER